MRKLLKEMFCQFFCDDHSVLAVVYQTYRKSTWLSGFEADCLKHTVKELCRQPDDTGSPIKQLLEQCFHAFVFMLFALDFA